MALTKVSYSMINGAAVNVLDYGSVGNDATSNTAALQAALNALTSGGTMYVPEGIYRSGALTVAYDNIEIVMEPRAVLKFNTLGSGVKAITINANNFAVRGGAIQGPAAAVYVGNENGLHMIGTSTSVRKTGLTVIGTEILQFGAYGIYAQFVDNINVQSCDIHDCGYSGATFLSCNHGVFSDNSIITITPGVTSNMYGISLTHDSTGYSSDPNAGTKQAANPFCWDWYVAGNHIEDINWEGIDAHGGYELRVIGNAIYDTYGGIAVTGSSGDAINYAGWSNVVANNVVDGRNSDGTVSGRENTNYGINLNGAATVTQKRVTCTGNIVLYKGIGSNANSGAIQAVNSKEVVISDNCIDEWQGSAVLITNAGVIASDNFIGARSSASDTSGICFSDQGPTANKVILTDNLHDPSAGIAALVGFSQIVGSSARPVLTGNNFAAATTAFNLSATGFCLGTDVAPIITDAGSGTDLDISAFNDTNGVVQLNNASPRTINTFTGAAVGQRVLFVNIGAGTQTITRTQAALNGGANQALVTKYCLELTWVGVTSPRQIAPISSNS